MNSHLEQPDVRYDAVVVGAGITGITVASTMAKLGMKVLVVGPKLGGIIRSEYVPTGYKFDYGGHVYDGTDPRFYEYLQRAGAVWNQRKAFYLHSVKASRGHGMTMWVPYPLQDHAEMLGYDTHWDRDGELAETFDRLLLNQFGPQLYNDVLRPFNHRVWSTEPSLMDVDWIHNRVPLRSTSPRPNWGPNNKFGYVPGGLLIQAIMDDGPQFDIIDATVTNVSCNERIIEVYQHEPAITSWVHCDFVVSTTLLPVLARWCRQAQPSTACGHLRSNVVMSVGVSARKCQATDALDFSWAYFDVKEKAHRITLLSRYYPGMAPAGYESFLVEIPVGQFSESPTTYVRQTDKLVAHYLGLDPNDCKIEWMGREMGYPAPTMGLRDAVVSFKRALPAGIYSVGRWGDHAYWNADACMRAARYLATMLAQGEIDEEAYEGYLAGSAGFNHPVS